MTHLYKVSLKFADLFIRSIDLVKGSIAYDVRDKETGLLLEPMKISKFVVHEGAIHFDMRFLSLQQVNHICEVLL